MKTIRQSFQKETTLFIPFIMAGYPTRDASVNFIRELSEAGADIIELGIPFSDPVADGVVNQEAAHCALENGMTLSLALEHIAEARALQCVTPIVLFSYLNPILAMGVEKFAIEAKKSGVTGVLIVDLPIEEGLDFYTLMAEQGLEYILLASPTTDPIRFHHYQKANLGFLYYISRLGTTGMQNEMSPHLENEVKSIRSYFDDLPIAVGFGISTPDQAKIVAAYADGVIVGSRLVKETANGQIKSLAQQFALAVKGDF